MTQIHSCLVTALHSVKVLSIGKAGRIKIVLQSTGHIGKIWLFCYDTALFEKLIFEFGPLFVLFLLSNLSEGGCSTLLKKFVPCSGKKSQRFER